jgi:hypothetical protein
MKLKENQSVPLAWVGCYKLMLFIAYSLSFTEIFFSMLPLF